MVTQEVPATDRTRVVGFHSNGVQLQGVLHLPVAAVPSGHGHPGIVVAGGFGGVKELRVPTICEGLADAGFVALRFDYQGFGESEGARWRLIPYEQAQNVRDAATFLAETPEVDPSRIGAYGNGWGGSPTIWAGALDEGIRALVLTATPGNGRRWLRSLRSPEEWQTFLDRLADDRAARVRTGRSVAVPSDEIMVPDRRTNEEHRKSDTRLDWRPMIPLESADAVLDFDAEPLLLKLAGRPILFIHAGSDALVPLAESEQNFRSATDPKRLMILEGAEHHDIYYEPWSSKAMAAAVAWFREYLP